jgi:hypothetical protein
MLAINGTDVRVSGLRFRGPSGETDDAYAFCGIRVRYGDFRIDNCYMYNCSKWAIDVVNNDGGIIECNLFYNNRRSGFGYGTWHRGVEPPLAAGVFLADADITVWRRNLAFHCRHECASAGNNDSSYKAYFNFCYEHEMVNHVFDRHQDGAWTEVKWNVCGNKGISYSQDSPVRPSKRCIV